MSDAKKKMLNVTIDGQKVQVPEGATIFEAAQQMGINIPVLCHYPQEIPERDQVLKLRPVGVCRVCVVKVEKARVFAAACVRPCEEGMVVTTSNEQLERDRKTLVEMLMADHPQPCDKHKEFHSCELELLAEKMGVKETPFIHRERVKENVHAAEGTPLDITNWLYSKGIDDSHKTFNIDHSACIVCDRCVRGCTEIKNNNVIGRMQKGYSTSISFDSNLPMGNSSCVNCGMCMSVCPTGAITVKASEKPISVLEGEPLTPREMLQINIFQGISAEFLKRNEGSVVRRRYKKGDIICREGEFGSTAFYILKGKCEIFLSATMGKVQSAKSDSAGLFQKFKHAITGRKESTGRKGGPTHARTDSSVDLPLDNPIATLGQDELFGEMTCLNFLPRSATVRASEDCEVLEMLRNVLHMLQRNRKFKLQLEKNYRERALGQHLRSVPILSNIQDPSFVDQLKNRVDLVHYEAGETIVKQGDVADAFYLIRVGCVRVSQNYPGGEMVITYLSRGEYFGEMGLLKGGIRTATCTALDHVEVVKIKKADFDFMLDWFEDLRPKFEAEAARREKDAKVLVERAPSMPLSDFLGQGLMHAQSLLLLDLEKCTRCDECVRACADAHGGVTRLVREGLRFDKYLVPTSCRSCMDPLCMVGCPVGSIRRDSNLEVIIEDHCVGCGLCAEQCPYGNISMHEMTVEKADAASGQKKAVKEKKAVLCDLCTDLREPSCVYACPHDAAHRVNARQFFMQKSTGN